MKNLLARFIEGAYVIAVLFIGLFATLLMLLFVFLVLLLVWLSEAIVLVISAIKIRVKNHL